jgi:hypothetical protein
MLATFAIFVKDKIKEWKVRASYGTYEFADYLKTVEPKK